MQPLFHTVMVESIIFATIFIQFSHTHSIFPPDIEIVITSRGCMYAPISLGSLASSVVVVVVVGYTKFLSTWLENY